MASGATALRRLGCRWMSSARIHGYSHYYGKLKNQDSKLGPSDQLELIGIGFELVGALMQAASS